MLFARTPGRRFWGALGGAVLAAWWPWWAVMGWEATHHFCCRGTMAGFALFGPAAPGFVLADPLLGLGREGVAAWAVGLSSAGAFLAGLTVAGYFLPRGRWAVWALAAAAQSTFAVVALGLIRA